MNRHNPANLGSQVAGRMLIFEVQSTKETGARHQFATCWDALKPALDYGKLMETERDAVVAAADYTVRQRLIVTKGCLFWVTMAIIRIVYRAIGSTSVCGSVFQNVTIFSSLGQLWILP